jgi:hypothetical protein
MAHAVDFAVPLGSCSLLSLSVEFIPALPLSCLRSSPSSWFRRRRDCAGRRDIITLLHRYISWNGVKFVELLMIAKRIGTRKTRRAFVCFIGSGD